MIHPSEAALQDFANAPAGTRMVCSGCFEDPALRDWIRDHSSRAHCDFCSAQSVAAVPLAKVVLRLMDCICLEYGSEQQDRFVSYHRFPFASAESWSTGELLFDEIGLRLPNDRQGQLRSAMLQQIGDWIWREVEWNTSEAEGCAVLPHTWEQFCHVVQFQRRFFFVPGADTDPEAKFAYVNVREVLERLRSFCLHEGLFRSVPVGTLLYRAEFEGDQTGAIGRADLGFPLKRATRTHLVLNPSGIPALYAAESIESILSACTEAGYYAIATYRVKSRLSVLDLTGLSAVPSIFAGPESEWYRRRYLVLAHKLRNAMARPAKQGASAALDYLPTQVVAEYFRVSFPGGTQGIRFPGMPLTAAPRLVLFEECTSAKPNMKKPLQNLVLQHVEHVRWDPAPATGA